MIAKHFLRIPISCDKIPIQKYFWNRSFDLLQSFIHKQERRRCTLQSLCWLMLMFDPHFNFIELQSISSIRWDKFPFIYIMYIYLSSEIFWLTLTSTSLILHFICMKNYLNIFWKKFILTQFNVRWHVLIGFKKIVREISSDWTTHFEHMRQIFSIVSFLWLR